MPLLSRQGSFTYHHVGYDLNLSIACIIHLYHSPELLQDYVEKQLSLPPWKKDIWVTRRKALKVVLKITSKGCLNFGSYSDTLRALQAVLENAEIWTQLGLKARVDSSLGLFCSDQRLYLALVLENASDGSGLATAHSKDGLLDSCGDLNVAVPSNVPFIILEEIVFEIGFSTESHSDGPYCYRTEMLAQLPASGHSHQHIVLHSSDMLQKTSDPVLFQEVVGPLFDGSSVDFEECLLNDHCGTISAQQDEWDPIVEDSRTEKMPQHVGVRSGLCEKQPIDAGRLIELVDASIRTFITGSPRDISPKLLPSDQSNVLKLMELAPEAFSPGYRRTLTEQSSFLPSIAQSIALVASRARSSALQDACTKIIKANCPSGSEVKYDGTAASKLPFLQSALWKVLQKCSYDRSAERTLKSMVSSRKPSYHHNHHHQEDDRLMLDGGSCRHAEVGDLTNSCSEMLDELSSSAQEESLEEDDVFGWLGDEEAESEFDLFDEPCSTLLFDFRDEDNCIID